MKLEKNTQTLQGVISGAVALSLLCSVAAAAPSYWIGGASGSFNTATNWDPEGVPNTAGSSAVFTNAATVSMSGAFCEIHALGGDLTINHSYRVSTVGNSQNEVIVEVGGGYTASFNFTGSDATHIFYGQRDCTFVKSGAGRLNVPRCLGYNTDYFKDFDIRDGTLALTENYGGLNSVDGYVHIADGATFLQDGGFNELPTATTVEIDAGGTLNYNNVGGTTLRGIVGAGAASGLGNSSSGVSLRGEGRARGSQGVFSGTLSGYVKMMPTNGMQMVFRSLGSSYADVQTCNAVIANGGVSDGGFCKDGPGCLVLNNSVACSGPIVMRSGKISANANAGSVLGIGSLQIDRGLVSIVRSRIDFLMATNALAKVTVNGPSAIRLDASNARLKIGAVGVASTPFAFGADGMLAFTLFPDVTALSSNPITINGGLPAGLPVYAYYRFTTSGATSSRKAGYGFIPVTTDGDSLLVEAPADYSNAFPTEDSGAVVRKGASEILDVPANAASIAELRVFGGAYISGAGEAIHQRKIGGVRIPQGVTLSVGDGSRGVVLLNNYYYIVTDDDGYGWARVYGEGTLDFGTSRGIVVAGDCYDSYSSENPNGKISFPAQVNCRIAGSAGVYFASPLTVDPTVSSTVQGRSALIGAYMRVVEVGGDNTYSGGTRIDSMVVQPLCETSLGVDAVTVVGDSNGGGELNFTAKYEGGEFSRDLTISDKGYPSTASASIWGSRAAVSAFGKKIRLTGAITLAGDATMASSGEDSHIVLEGQVSGEGTLHVTSGRVIVKKQAYDAYKAGKIVADEGAEIVERPAAGMLLIVL